jgi:ABC-type sugar transport system ATPase subunit
MVFQSYALYPHWTIYENLAFGLRMRNLTIFERLNSMFYQLLFYIGVFAIFYGICYIIDVIFENLGLLIFATGMIGGILTLLMFSEVRSDIRLFALRIGAKRSKTIRNMLDTENHIEEDVIRTSRLLGIEEQLYKKPKQLSGGQRQRVALGRAIIRSPKVFLMDEPLSNLDAKLRVQMRAELQRLQKKLKTTTIYVTHDQIEAMTLADRIAIMNEGILQQVGSPDDVYADPSNKFVAGFIGSPSMNFIEGTISSEGGTLKFECPAFKYTVPQRYTSSLSGYQNKNIWLGVRPEHIQLSDSSADPSKLQASIGVLEPIGSDTYVYIDFKDESTLIVKVEGAAPFKLDQQIDATFDSSHVHFFNKETEERIIPS